MITDGEPTAHINRHGQPEFHYPPVRETVEMLYEFEAPLVVDHSQFATAFGAGNGSAPTPQAQAVAETVPMAQSRGTELELIADAPVPIRGDAPALVVLARNLVDNAVRYASPGTRVEVQVGLDGSRPVLQVDDAGPGIPPAERERVFDRFYRRSGGEEQGSGLGLAIVRSVARRHGAEVELGESPAHGLRVTVRFAV